MSAINHTLYTVGYAAFFRPENFVARLRQHEIGAVVDARAFPELTSLAYYRGRNLAQRLAGESIHYLSFAEEFGARPKEARFYSAGAADFDKIAASDIFRSGLGRLSKGLLKFNICLMCAEKDPAVCHRAILITHQFEKLRPDATIRHIMPDGCLSQADIDREVCKSFGLVSDDIDNCYRLQAKKIAWRKDSGKPENRPSPAKKN